MIWFNSRKVSIKWRTNIQTFEPMVDIFEWTINPLSLDSLIPAFTEFVMLLQTFYIKIPLWVPGLVSLRLFLCTVVLLFCPPQCITVPSTVNSSFRQVKKVQQSKNMPYNCQSRILRSWKNKLYKFSCSELRKILGIGGTIQTCLHRELLPVPEKL